jgi:quinol monooxygenase YgiN
MVADAATAAHPLTARPGRGLISAPVSRCRGGDAASEEGRRMDGPVAVVFEAAVKPGQAEAVRALSAEMVASTGGESGTLAYAFFASDDGAAAVAYERYADSAAGLAHLAVFGERFAGRLLALADPTRVTVLKSPSEEFRTAAAAFGPASRRPVGGFVR